MAPYESMLSHGDKLPDSKPGFWNANAGGGLGHGFVGGGEGVGDGRGVGADEVVVEFWGHSVSFPDTAPRPAIAGQRSQPLGRPTCRPGYVR